MKTRKEKIEIKVREKFWRNTIKNNYALFLERTEYKPYDINQRYVLS